jgi:hypothetical protein
MAQPSSTDLCLDETLSGTKRLVYIHVHISKGIFYLGLAYLAAAGTDDKRILFQLINIVLLVSGIK